MVFEYNGKKINLDVELDEQNQSIICNYNFDGGDETTLTWKASSDFHWLSAKTTIENQLYNHSTFGNDDIEVKIFSVGEYKLKWGNLTICPFESKEHYRVRIGGHLTFKSID